VMEMGWLDETPYSLSDKERIPRIWRYQFKDCWLLSVHKLHGLDGWFLDCYELRIKDHVLKHIEEDKAREEALYFIHDKLKKMILEVREAVGNTEMTG